MVPLHTAFIRLGILADKEFLHLKPGDPFI